MKYFLILFCVAGITLLRGQSTHTKMGLGIIADCQYADQPIRGVRHYRNSPKKLQACVDTFNDLELEHVFHLGDFIDDDAQNFIVVQEIMDGLVAPHTHVLGNHDYSIADELKSEVHVKMGMPSRYFTRDIQGWRFLIVDGNDISMHAYAKGSRAYQKSVRHYERKFPELPNWNGALSKKQMKWMKSNLEEAQREQIPVILLCHFPIYPADAHNLWNAQQVLDLITGYSVVKAWLNGHNHAGNYGMKEGIHFVTFKGMVDTKANAYAHLLVGEDEIQVNGFGREEDRTLVIKK